METHKGTSITNGKNFYMNGNWAPPTPAKPNGSQSNPIYNNGHGGLLPQAWREQGSYLSGYTQQQIDPQTLLSYSNSIERNNFPTPNNTVWRGPHETPSLQGRIQLERQNVEIHRRGLEEHLPNWSSQGRRTVMNYGSNLGSTSYPRFSSWDLPPLPLNNNGVGNNGATSEQNFTDSLGGFDNMSFGDILRMDQSMTLLNNGDVASNAMFNPGWVSQPGPSRLNNVTMVNNQDARHGMNQQTNSLCDRGMQNDALPRSLWSMGNVNLPPIRKHGNGSAVVAPETPDSRQRIQRNGAPDKAHSDINQGQNSVPVQENHNNTASEPIVESTPRKVSITVDEDYNPDKEVIQDVDLNTTPQKKPRKRRYQPKVIRENKPKGTPKPNIPKPTETSDPAVKKKHTRKNKTDTPSTMPPGKNAETKSTQPTVKSCKKSLNFNLNGGLETEGESSNYQETGKSSYPVNFVATYDLNHTINQELSEYISLPVEGNLGSSQTDMNSSLNQKLKSPQSLSTKEVTRSSISYASSSEGVQTRGSKRSLSYTNDPIYFDVGIGAVTRPTPWQLTNTSPKSTHTEILSQSFIPEFCKRKRTEKIQRLNIQSISSSIAPSEDIGQLGKTHSQKQIESMTSKYYDCNSAPFAINGMTDNQAELLERSESMEQFAKTWADLSRFKKKRTKVATRVRDMTPLTGIASVAKSASKMKVDFLRGHYPSTTTLNGVLSCSEALAADSNATTISKRRSKQQQSVNKNWNIVPYDYNRTNTKELTGSSSDRPWRKRDCSIEYVTKLLQQLDLKRESRKTPSREKSVINYEKHNQNALVLYQRDGSMVPFEGPFNPSRKRRPRAKVDLDDESDRVWRLLLENINNEGINGTDEDKAKWWDDERRVFRGRVDSFIARMRLVQGDRRFTPWKGSVLDSVIGVFLTQNVSDHLSSSAFMSMAARFPLKPESSGSTESEATSALFPEPEVFIFEPEESVTWNEKEMDRATMGRNNRVIYDLNHEQDKEVVNSNEQTGKAGSVSPTEGSSESNLKAPKNSRAFNLNIVEDDNAREDATSPQESFISSQTSINLPNMNTIGMMNTFSESNSRTRDVRTSCKFNYLESTGSFLGLLQIAEDSSHPNLLDQPEGVKRTTESYQPAPGVPSSNYQLQQEAGLSLQHIKGFEMLEGESRPDIIRKDENSPAEHYQAAPGGTSSNYQLNLEASLGLQAGKAIDILEIESISSDMSRKDENSPTTEQSNLTSELTDLEKSPDTSLRAAQTTSFWFVLEGNTMVRDSQMQKVKEPLDAIASCAHTETSPGCKGTNEAFLSQEMTDVTESTWGFERRKTHSQKVDHIPEQNYASGVLSDKANTNPSHFSPQEMAGVTETIRGLKSTKIQDKKLDQIPEKNHASGVHSDMGNTTPSKTGRAKAGKEKKNGFDWDSLRRDAQVNGRKPERPAHNKDSLDWEEVRHANVNVIADTIKERGMNNMLAERIKALLDRLVKDHGSTDMEWLRDIPPDKAKEYLLSFRGLGLKSVECVRLLTLHHLAFPVDTNVGRIAVRLGWVPLQPLPESLQLHLLEMYPILESIQKYLWPRLCRLDQKTLYELHYHMITFGKVFCTKRQPNCNACPLKAECRHFASAFSSARSALPSPEEKSIVPLSGATTSNVNPRANTNLLPPTPSWGNHNPRSNSKSYETPTTEVPSFPFLLPYPQDVHLERKSINSKCEPIIEVPASPEQEPQQDQTLCDIEDTFYEDPNEIPTIDLNMEDFTKTLHNFMHANREHREGELSNALVALKPEAASIPTPKLKNINRLRTEHYVYELPDTHPLLHRMEKREPDDPCSYLLALWTPGENANSIDPPARRCSFNDTNMLCNEETCSYCSSQREADSQVVRGTLLIPTRTAMRGSFPLNGTYFQVNEVFADHDSSLNPIAVPRSWLWNLPRRTVYFGTSIPTIFKGMNTEDIQHCFWRGYVCVRGFDQKTRAPRPLMARLHFPASRTRGVKGKLYDE